MKIFAIENIANIFYIYFEQDFQIYESTTSARLFELYAFKLHYPALHNYAGKSIIPDPANKMIAIVKNDVSELVSKSIKRAISEYRSSSLLILVIGIELFYQFCHDAFILRGNTI